MEIAKALVITQAGEGAIESLREFHIKAITELAESLAWYAKCNPATAMRVRRLCNLHF